MSLSAILKEKRYKVHIKDGYFIKEKKILESIKKNNINGIEFSCASYNWKKSKEIIKEVKMRFPKIITIVGGPHPNALKEMCLKESKYIDIV